ncbi:2OG-Fe(II) oxygenase [Ochrovirga pacifica]|uniref:2OG-Fe(II) oxygenase n=1 Tax=Ochrovirga pacifica TaxID=1042376 RepID=UPI0002558B1D|nr:2OG-Fe(II) oxygenase [Ochrovirga pacifica]
MTTKHQLEDWLFWVDELSQNDFVIIDNFLNPSDLLQINQLFQETLPDFTKAGIGAINDHVIRQDIRGDHTYWLDRKRDISIPNFWSLIDESMAVFNRYCYLGLAGYEFHFAKYPPGTLYKKHLDQFSNRTNRTITMVLYLNKNWQKGDGGELELFLENNKTLTVDPILGRCIFFKSAVVPHRVIEANKDRYSLTGWFLQQPSALGQILG